MTILKSFGNSIPWRVIKTECQQLANEQCKTLWGGYVLGVYRLRDEFATESEDFYEPQIKADNNV